MPDSFLPEEMEMEEEAEMEDEAEGTPGEEPGPSSSLQLMLQPPLSPPPPLDLKDKEPEIEGSEWGQSSQCQQLDLSDSHQGKQLQNNVTL